ncbi:pyridoxal 5'-phosphate synthase glutaminase subunit PdxT [Candidatus Weimeria sp. HCP3S3_B5]|uniref:pyridoxal 5'-phosphate synthase glutaminase subunit PdxT n=1 Tax=Candidatus Weimeria sp. HCP3S3_B5 TaxID=3438871 RepID=UPI002A9574B7|nr:pyridoxal 5'-phosphate synthase glutaminase subunit PdxT [Lachnospiraceae bacterium]
MSKRRIGVLALQGAFYEHERILVSLGEDTSEVRRKEDLKGISALIIPGGESTTIGKLLRELDILDPLKVMIDNGLPVMGTCAGEILLADSVDGRKSDYIATIPMNVRRNAYGRQLGSFIANEDFYGIDGKVPMCFIRAPYIESAGQGVRVVARCNGRVVGVRYDSQLAISFHPEISGDTRIHSYFLNSVMQGQSL